jgi:hypothetical protein
MRGIEPGNGFSSASPALSTTANIRAGSLPDCLSARTPLHPRAAFPVLPVILMSRLLPENANRASIKSVETLIYVKRQTGQRRKSHDGARF